MQKIPCVTEINVATTMEIGKCQKNSGSRPSPTVASEIRKTGMQPNHDTPVSSAPYHGRFTTFLRKDANSGRGTDSPASSLRSAGRRENTSRTQRKMATG